MQIPLKAREQGFSETEQVESAFDEEAKRVRDPAKRKEPYTEAWNVVNEDLRQFYRHELTVTSAAVKALRGCRPYEVAPFIYGGSGIRAAYPEA